MLRCTIDWIKQVNEKYNIEPSKVLDVGSIDRNGSPRHLFPNSEYVGIDIKKGNGVDCVVSAYDVFTYFGTNYCDAVLCLYIFEHLERFWEVLSELDLVLRKGGYFYVAMPTIGYPVHNYPKDFWRITEQSMRSVIMNGYKILSLEFGKSPAGKHPIINCLGVKKE